MEHHIDATNAIAASPLPLVHSSAAATTSSGRHRASFLHLLSTSRAKLTAIGLTVTVRC
uniref:Uncharacterized protein n=1 Tax=Arundo donax TaxID=35708 RepID=A0A0A9BI41_ARUDO